MRLPGVLTGVARATVRVDRAQLQPVDGLRTALGVALPLAVGLAVDRPLDGAFAAGGALGAGFAVYQTGYRTRALAVLAASAAVAVSTFVGALVSSSTPLLVLVLAVWGAAAGMLVPLGLAATVVGVQAVIGLLVVTQYPMPLDHAAGRAALAFAGGLGQVLLVMTVWPLRRFPTERRALAAVYRSLAAYAAAVPSGEPAPPRGQPMVAARSALGDPQPFARGDELLAFTGLLDDAERLRTSLAALAQTRPQLAGVPHRAPAVAALDDLAAAAADVLAAVARAVEVPSVRRRTAALLAVGERASPLLWARLDDAVETLRIEARMAGPARRHAGASLVAEVARRSEHLVEQLRSAVRVAGAPPAGERPVRRPLLSGRDAVATVRASLSLRAPAGRHAVRLGLALAAGAAAASLLPFEHRYWLPLTVAVVLKPDFASTFTRGTGRILGTLAGAVAATALAGLLEPGPVLLTVLVAVLAWAAYTVFFANYALYAVSMTGIVVFLLAFTGAPDPTTALDRVEATVLGGLLALAAYALWPTWERVRVPEQLARLLTAQERYVSALLAAYADPPARDVGRLRELRVAARLARATAEASVERMAAEPGAFRGTLPPDAARGLLAAARRLALAALALHAHLPQAEPDPDPAALAALASGLRASLQESAAALREARAPQPLPDLAGPQERMAAALRSRADAAGEQSAVALDAAVLDVETAQLVASATRTAEVLRRAGSAARPRRRRRRSGRRP